MPHSHAYPEASPTNGALLPSAQISASGEARFYVSQRDDDPAWALAAEREGDGGVAAELRLFLDAQLETDDLVIDLSPGFGFVSLSAATAPHVSAQVHAIVEYVDEGELLERDAQRAGTSITTLLRADIVCEGLNGWLARTTHRATRVFVHTSVGALAATLDGLRDITLHNCVAALLCDAGDTGNDDWRDALQALRAHGFQPYTLVAHDDDMMLVDALDAMLPTRIIALPIVEHRTGAETRAMPNGDGHGSDSGSLNFIAPFCRTGYGIAGANLLNALLELDVDVGFFPLGAIDRRIAHVPSLDRALARQESYIASAPSVRMSQQFDLAFHVGSGPRIGFPIFEIDRFTPRELHHLGSQDQLLVCSAWARDVLRDNGLDDIRIDIVPLGVDRAIFNEDVKENPRWASAGEDTCFLQIGKIEPRKGQLDLLRAFEAAFTPRDQVRLTLICHNPFVDALQLAELLAPFSTSRMAHRIDIVSEPLATHHDVARAIRTADCGVYCSRAEGWNLELLETLSAGKPVIATNYSAHTEYLTSDNARLIEIDTLERAGVGSWAAFGARQHEQLVEYLRAVHRARRDGPLPMNVAGIETAMSFSWERSAKRLLDAVIHAG